MKDQKITFALFFGNRGFFPGEVIASARREVTDAVTAAGYGYIVMEESLTRYGAVETIAEGKKYAEFLAAHRGEYDGVLLCLPNFGDENGMLVALKDAGVPVVDIHELKEIAERITGKPQPIRKGERTAANVIYRDGTQIDTIKCVPSK